VNHTISIYTTKVVPFGGFFLGETFGLRGDLEITPSGDGGKRTKMSKSEIYTRIITRMGE
jgi:hypothetical protein